MEKIVKVISQNEKKKREKTRDQIAQHSNQREQRKWSKEKVWNKVSFPELNKHPALN